ncbi:MAG: DUF2961 domain-containing protein [Bacteroidetes bacterium]|jgi:hypothetical protein|nr:DUF2961 domain-containing protein [Bacteroidota bacterium]
MTIMIRIALFALLTSLSLPAFAQTITMGSLLQEMTDRSSLAKYPAAKYTTKQFSSYDRQARIVDGAKENWYANEDRTNFLRKEVTENGTEWVMFDSDQPGAIVRWWMTFAGEGAGDGTLRIYIDGAESPAVEGRAYDLMSGGLLAYPPLSASVSPTTVHKRRGHNLYLPIPYNACKITYQGEGIKTNAQGEITKESVAIYYNINYRAYEEGTAVESFGPNSVEQYLKAINRAQQALLHPYTGIFNRPADKTQKLRKLAPGERIELSLSGAKYIKALALRLEAENQSQALRSTVLSLSFDGEERLTVPVGDFFGTGYEINPYETYYTKVFYDGKMAAFWPMPFQKEATIELINYGEQLVSVHDLEVYTDDWSWDDRSMYFGGSWKQFYNKQTGGGKAPEDLDFVKLQGQGVYVGDLITLYNDIAAWWGEGDEKIYVDGEAFPSHFGTGTEDYYGYAWSRPEFFEHPFIAQPDGSGNLDVGTAINIRFRALDKIPFTQELDMDMELWHWTKTSIDYAPTTFFYTKPDGRAIHEFQPEQAQQPVRFAPQKAEQGSAEMKDNSIQGENMEAYRIDGGKLVHRNFADWKWEEDAQVAWWGASVGDVVIMRFRSPKAIEDARLELQLTKSGNYAIVSLAVNGSEEVTFDGYAPEITVDTLDMEGVDIQEGWNTVRVRVTGKNPKSKNLVFGLDYLKVRP